MSQLNRIHIAIVRRRETLHPIIVPDVQEGFNIICAVVI